MFQCIIQQRNGWAGARGEMKEVFPDLRIQLQDQLKSLDSRLDSQVTLTQELQDFFRKKAEVELEYGRNLEKLAKSLTLRQKEKEQKRDFNIFSVSSIMNQLIRETKKQSQEHVIISEIYGTHVTGRLAYVAEDLQRVYKQSREITHSAHEELLKVLHELHTSTKTFHAYQTESKQTESKLRIVELQKTKLETTMSKEKVEKSKKMRLVEKEMQKRRNKYTDARFKALKAKNEYILCMDAANSAVQKYFVDDLSDLIDCMDLGFYQCIARAINTYVSTQDQQKKTFQTNMEQLTRCMNNCDSRLDKQKFLEANNAFIMPKKFEFQQVPVRGQGSEEDSYETPELEATGFIRNELEQRLIQLHRRLDALRTESDECWKTLETAENSLLEMLTARDWDTAEYFDSTKTVQKDDLVKLRAERIETDEFHLQKFHDYMLGTNRIARLQGKYDHIRRVLGETDLGGTSPALAQTLGTQSVRKTRRKRIGGLRSRGNPRLFGGSLEEYIEVSGQEIPIVLKSCIRIINLYGLQHQGIFRVSGSQVEKNNFKDAFERGEDPLADINDASDINSVAGVLKTYLRELREPLFPIVYFEQFMELAQLESKHVFVVKMRDLVKSLPRSVFVVLRYLFAFLRHLTEYSDENMMDPYNLAICFGPTLVPVPEDKDQVQYQNLVNELIKNVIIYSEDIFPVPEGGDGSIVYEKYICKESEEGDVGDAPLDQSQDELDSEIGPSEDDSVFLKDCDLSLHIFEKSEFLEAVAQFDFVARSKRELSFKKGDSITLYSQVSGDWWKGSVGGLEGLVPDKYIMLKIRDEDARHSSTSKESPRIRTASDSFLNTKPAQMSLSPSLHEPRRHLYVQTPSPSSFLAVSGESLASTSPESGDELGHLEKGPVWNTAPARVLRTVSTPTSQSSEKADAMAERPARSLSVVEDSTSAHESKKSKDIEQESATSFSEGPEPIPVEIAPPEEKQQTTLEPEVSLSIQLSFPESVENDDPPTAVVDDRPPSRSSSSVKYFKRDTDLSQSQATACHSRSRSEDLPSSQPKPKVQSNIQFWEQRARTAGHTPDLVMDLPLQDESSQSGSASPVSALLESPELTAAECFAKHQCTLKKKDVENLKPQVKVKPLVLKKPALPSQLVESPPPSTSKGFPKPDEERSTDL